jgi:hypothetical protein
MSIVARFRERRAPLCFMHVPKSAGTSVMESLQASLPDGTVAPARFDTFIFCRFSAFDQLDEQSRSLVAVEAAEIAALARYRVVGGHFPLPVLRRLAPASKIATVLREPRARVLSAYMFLRLTRMMEIWEPYAREVLEGPAQSLEAFLSDPRIARLNDNQICRLVLHGDSRMRDEDFVAPGDAEGLAEAALERLDQLGYVGILERDDVWSDLSSFFGVPLDRVRTNVSGDGDVPDGALPFPPFDMKVVLDSIERRSVADRIVYEALLGRSCGDAGEARRIADAAFAAELVHFGDVTGTAATKLSGLSATAAAAGGQSE